MEKLCIICGTKFIANNSLQKYCHNPCNPKIAWKINHREKDLKLRREYNQRRKQNLENVEKDRLAAKRWRDNNPDKRKFYKYKRRALEKIGNGFTEKEWQEMKKEYNYTCPRCGKKEPEITLTIDHIYPLSLGGWHEKENIQPLCMACNRWKQQQIIIYAKWV